MAPGGLDTKNCLQRMYVDKKIAGFVLIQKGSPISYDKSIWDVSEFFVMRKYRCHGVGRIAASKTWEQFKGPWQVRVLLSNPIAQSFWKKSIKAFTGKALVEIETEVKQEDWMVYTFESL